MTEIRPIRPDELGAFLLAMSGPFGFDPPEGDEFESWIERAGRIFEPERSQVAFDGERIVGTLGTFSFDMTVPGGSMPVAGTTMVTVQVTHRRRGVLSSMISAHLDEARDRGDACAALWASDSAIYGRFGYGMAAWNTELEIDRRHVDLHRLAPSAAEVMPITSQDLRPEAVEVYDILRPQVPGMVGHSEGWWDRIFRDDPHDGSTRARYGLVREDGRPTGWVKYRLKNTEGHGHPAQDVLVSQLYAVTPQAWTGLWLHVLTHDFGHTIKAELRPVDDPIHSLLRGMRRVSTRRLDGLWVRVLDVAKTLEARRYDVDGAVRFEVVDRLGHAAGVYALEASGGAGTVSEASEGDVRLDVEDLGALCLGGRSATELARAGRITGDPAVVRRLDLMLRGTTAPWSPVIF